MTWRWVGACAAAETLGMAAAAGAARAAGETGTAPGLLLVIAGGLVEGAALGLLQGWAIAPRLGQHRTSWAATTAIVAGVGWAIGSAPTALANDDGGTAPPLALVLAGAGAMGAVMGAALGLAQALVLRRSGSRHPWRWVSANAAGWTLAMPVIFLGASTAGGSWSWPLLLGWGASAGAAAGTVLGAVTGAWLPSLEGLPLRHRLVLTWLVHRGRDMRAGWTGLDVTGRRSGRSLRFPVMTAPLGDRAVVVLPGHPERKSWWRQLGAGADVHVLDHGEWLSARARPVSSGSPDWQAARSAYAARWPRAQVGSGPLVVVRLASSAPE